MNRLVAGAAAVLIAATLALAACGDDTKTVTRTPAVTVPAQTSTTTVPSGASSGGAGPGGNSPGSSGNNKQSSKTGGTSPSEYQQCIEQVHDPSFCSNPPPGE